LEQRALVKMPVRQVLASATVRGRIKDWIINGSTISNDWMNAIIADELNVHGVVIEPTNEVPSVELDIVLTPALKREGAARELTRTVNDLRKQAGLTIADRITVRYATGTDFWRDVLAEHGNTLLEDVKADAFEQATEMAEEGSAGLENDGQMIRVKVEKK
jgi:isoleucyl-tRNA synthetase